MMICPYICCSRGPLQKNLPLKVGFCLSRYILVFMATGQDLAARGVMSEFTDREVLDLYLNVKQDLVAGVNQETPYQTINRLPIQDDLVKLALGNIVSTEAVEIGRLAGREFTQSPLDRRVTMQLFGKAVSIDSIDGALGARQNWGALSVGATDLPVHLPHARILSFMSDPNGWAMLTVRGRRGFSSLFHIPQLVDQNGPRFKLELL